MEFWICGLLGGALLGVYLLRQAARLDRLERRLQAVTGRPPSPRSTPPQLAAELLEHSSLACAVLDRRRRYVFASRRWLAVHGLEPEEVAGRRHDEVFRRRRPGWTTAWERVLAGEVARGEDRWEGGGSRAECIEWECRPWSDAGGSVQGVLVYYDVVTGRRAAEEEGRESEERFRSAFESAATGMALVSADGRWLKVNRSLCTMLGYSEEELLETTFHALTHPDDLYRDIKLLHEVLAGKRRFCQMEKRYFHKDGHAVWVLLSISHVRDAAGRPLYLIFQMQDVTEWKRAQEELQVARDRAEAASTAKSRFLASMSHEIRTPLHSILGMAELCLGADLAPEERRYMDIIRASGRSLLSIINDILDFAKVEAGKLTLDPVTFDLRALLDESLASFEPLAREKGLALTACVAAEVPSQVYGDPGRLRQVLVNLIGNALRFTDSGEVAVSALVESPGEEGLTVRFAVRDTGIGIPREKQQLIFEAFSQVDASTTRRYGGTGLGLAISSTLVRLMGGRICVESEPGRGSTFSFTVSLGRASEAAASGAGARGAPAAAPEGAREGAAGLGSVPAPARKLRVLVAEDNPFGQELARALLSRWGHDVAVAATGRAAVEMATAGDFDLVLMDMEMPEMDGVEATRVLRERDRGRGRRTPVVALTANALGEDRERCLAAGFDAYVSKPVASHELFDVIERIAAAAGAPGGAEEREEDPAVDLERLRGHLGAQYDELTPRLVAIAFREFPKQLAALEGAVRSGAVEELQRVAHTVKGAAGQLGALGAQELARELEECGRRGETDRARELVAELGVAVERARAFFARQGWLTEETAP